MMLASLRLLNSKRDSRQTAAGELRLRVPTRFQREEKASGRSAQNDGRGEWLAVAKHVRRA